MTDTTANKPVERNAVTLGKNYWKLWTASVTSNLGDGVVVIAYP